MRGWHAERYPDASQRMTVVLNGWEPELLGQVPFRRPDPQRPLRFGYVGTVTEPMPLETLFEAWEKARSAPELSGARLEIFGHLGFFPHTAAALRARLPGEDSGVEYMGGVPKAELAGTYEHLDVLVFCVPGAKYVTSGKVYEYMAAGKPIVSVHEPDIAAVDVLKGHPLWFPIDSLDPASGGGRDGPGGREGAQQVRRRTWTPPVSTRRASPATRCSSPSSAGCGRYVDA